MTYELVLAVVPSDTLDLVERAYELMDPFCHTEECWERWHDEENYDAEGEYKLPRCEHLWDGANVGGHYHSGCLWRDRYGQPMSDHPINIPEDEIRRVGEVDLRFLYLSPTGLVSPDGDIYFMAGKASRWGSTITQFIAYEERLMAYPDHLAIPMACHS